MRKLVATLFALAALSALSSYAQTAQPKPELLLYHPPTPLSYEVATIKPIDPKTADSMVRLPPGVPNGFSPLSIRRYIMDAYGAIYQAQVVGGPDWLDKDSYRINGKPSAELEAEQRSMKIDDWVNQNHAMQQSLLADRFLRAHFETRILPVYELVPAKGGLKVTAVAAPPDRHLGDAPLPLPPPPPPPSQSGVSPPPALPLQPGTLMTMFNTSVGLNSIRASAIKMASLARTISNSAATELEPRPIVDHTGFTGYFDIKDLTFAPLSASATETPSAPFLQRALEDQLGIKIQPARAPVEVLVIDSIDRASEN